MLACFCFLNALSALADPPAITVSPVNSTNCAEDTTAFTVAATGSAPLSYQWYQAGTNALAGATNATLTFTNLQASDGGPYTVVVIAGDGSGSTTSSPPALLVVNPLPIVTVNSAIICIGGSAILNAKTDPGDVAYLWLPDGQTTPAIGVSPASNTTYQVLVVHTNLDGTTCSASAFGTVTVNPLTLAVNSAVMCAGDSATLTATTDGTNAAYSWFPDGQTTPSITVSPTSTTTYQLLLVSTNLDGTTCSTSASGTVMVNPVPLVSVNSATICSGGLATLTATTDATNTSFSWSPDGQTSPSITVSPTSNTTYQVMVVTTNEDGTTCAVSASATVTVNPPVSISGPTDLTLCPGVAADFTVIPSDSVTLTYQWLKDGLDLGVTNSTLSLSNISVANAGTYFVVASGNCSTITNTARLTVLSGVAITTQPSNLIVTANSPAMLAVVADGAEPLRYQWQYFGGGLEGETNSTLTIPSAQSTNAGDYRVVVTDACHSITSAVATLVVSPLQVTFIPVDGVWRYLDDGSEQEGLPGIIWRALNYNDSHWAAGPARLGYGETPDGQPLATSVGFGSDPTNKNVTTYFRYTFVASNLLHLTNLTASLQSLDGAIVYLNYWEAYRNLMPTGATTSATLATPAAPPEPGEPLAPSRTINKGLLNEGTNVLSVAVHLSAVTNANMSFGLKLTARYGEPLPVPTAVTRGPYLQMGTPASITVRWRTNIPTNSWVNYGVELTNLTSSVSNDEVTTDHIVTLTNLLSDTKYYYAVGAGELTFAAGADYFFVTAPAIPRPSRIWVIGDSGTAGLLGGTAEAVRDAYYASSSSRYTDVWLMLGDNAYYEGTDEQYQGAVFDTYSKMLRQTVLWPTIGNHETYDPYPDGHLAYFDIFTLPTRGEAGGVASGTENYYSFDFSSIHFVCLDSETSDRTASGPMLTWLQEDLAANTNNWLIAFWHSPPYTHGSHNSDDPQDSYGALVQMRETVLPVLESYGVDLVLCGHSHDYERSFLLDGHYDFSTTLAQAMIKDAGSGRPDDTGAYLKSDLGPSPHQGTVYVVNGCSGWAVAGGALDHPAMFKSLLQTGSLVLDIDGNRLDAKFLRETGAIDDYFTILKGVPPEPLRLASLQIFSDRLCAKWKSVPGKAYRLQRADSFPIGTWTDISGAVTATGATTIWTYPVPSSGSAGFFRVIEVQN